MSDITPPPPGTTPPPAGGAPAGAPPPGAGAPPPDWRSHITDEAMRAAPFVSQSQAKTIEEALNDMVKQNFNAQKLIGGEKVLKPQANWTPEQWKEWRKGTLNVPDTIDGYKYDTTKFKDIVDESALGTFKSHFLAAGLTPDQVQTVLDKYFDYAATSYKAQDEAATATRAEKQAALKKAWGNDYDKNMELVDYALTRLGGDELKTYFKANPDSLIEGPLANFILKAGKMISGDNPAGMKEGSPIQLPNASHPVEIRNQIQQLRRDPDYEKVLRAGSPSALRAQMYSRNESGAEAIIEHYNEINKALSAMYEKLGATAQ